MCIRDRLIRDQGFDVRRADLDDVKRLMAVYFVQDFTSEHYDDFDGQRWVEWTGCLLYTSRCV